jgi:hypothetical protein
MARESHHHSVYRRYVEDCETDRCDVKADAKEKTTGRQPFDNDGRRLSSGE